MGLTSRVNNILFDMEPFFDKIDLGTIPEDYINNEQKNTRYDLRSKFVLTDDVDVMIYEVKPLQLKMSTLYIKLGYQYHIMNPVNTKLAI